jgi:hypothetical protein
MTDSRKPATMPKRFRRRPTPPPGTLKMYWGLDEDGEGPDLVVAWGEGVAKGNVHLISQVFNSERMALDPKNPRDHVWVRNLRKELEARGFDLSTLTFSIRKKASE